MQLARGLILQTLLPNVFILGSPFYTYVERDGQLRQGSQIYFPVFADGNIIKMIVIANLDGEWNSAMTGDFVSSLNSLPKNSISDPYKIIATTEQCFALNSSGNYLLAAFRNFSQRKYSFSLSDFNTIKTLSQDITNNLKDITHAIRVEKQQIEDSSHQTSTRGYLPGFSVNASTEKQLNMSGCHIGQGGPTCWAAVTAVAYRYRTGNRTMTDREVCNRTGFAYDGLVRWRIYEAFNILNVANDGVNSYKFWGSYLYPNQVKHNLDNRFPFEMDLLAYDELNRHAVCAEGYKMSGNDMRVYYWNTANQSIELSYLFNSNSYSVRCNVFGDVWTWEGTTCVATTP